MPLDLGDWSLICFQFEGRYYFDVSLPFGLRCAVSHYQGVINCVTGELRRQGLTLLNYINDFRVVAKSKAAADHQFPLLQGLLAHLWLHEASHKSSPPIQEIVL